MCWQAVTITKELLTGLFQVLADVDTDRVFDVPPLKLDVVPHHLILALLKAHVELVLTARPPCPIYLEVLQVSTCSQ